MAALLILNFVETLGMGLIMLVFLVSGVAKLASPQAFRMGLLSIPYMKQYLTYPIAFILPLLEIFVALGIYFNFYLAKITGLILLLSFEVVIFITLKRKLKIDCHCFGNFSNRKISKGTFLANLALMSFLLLDVSMSGMFLDIVSLLTSLALLTIYLVLDLLFKNHKLILENYAAGTS